MPAQATSKFRTYYPGPGGLLIAHVVVLNERGEVVAAAYEVHDGVGNRVGGKAFPTLSEALQLALRYLEQKRQQAPAVQAPSVERDDGPEPDDDGWGP